MTRAVRLLVGVALASTVTLAACSKPSTSTGGTGGATSGVATGSGAAGSSGSSSVSESKHLNIGYFGFAKANSFAQAGWAGVSAYAKAHNASATFVDSNFDGPTQVNQLQDAATSKRYDVIILQANDGTAAAAPVAQAVAAGIAVVVQFTPVGGRFDTIQPQVPGTINIIDPPTVNGVGLAKLGSQACKATGHPTGCQVAYFQGFANYPLDTARTKAAVDALKSDGVADVISNLVGGYTPDAGRAAMQNLLQSHPNVNVVIGSSQALEGATPLAQGKKITFVGNGGSSQAFNYIMNGTWYGVYDVPEKTEGAKAAEYGLLKARGGNPPVATNTCDLTKFACLGTKQTLAGLTADYSD
jgi:ribose transport system substrate-binding protein